MMSVTRMEGMIRGVALVVWSIAHFRFDHATLLTSELRWASLNALITQSGGLGL